MRCLKILAAVCGLAVLSVLVRTPKTTYAVTDNTFNIVTSPLPINLQAKPGTTISTDIKLKNGGANTEKLKVTLLKFSAYGDEGKPSIQDRAPGDDYFDWVHFSPNTFDAPTNEWITIKMSIDLPKTAAFGYYYAVVISRAAPPRAASGKQNVLVGSTAILVLVDAQVPGANRTATITSFTADKSFYEFLPTNFSIKIHNSGNVHLIPTGNIFITRGNKAVATIDINSVAGNVLPNSNRIFTTLWKDGFPVYVNRVATGKVVLNQNDKPVNYLQWDFSKASHLRFGHYSAHLVMAYDNGSRDVPLEATVSFWVIPWRVIAIIIAVPVIPSVVVYFFMKRRFKHRLNKITNLKTKEKKHEEHSEA